MEIRVGITGAGGERSSSFAKPEVSIGRLPSNDVILPEAGVSSNHAKVVVTDNALTIIDLDSTNGTFVNGEPLKGPHVITDGDKVEIGDFVLQFSLGEVGYDGAAVGSNPPAARADRPGLQSSQTPDLGLPVGPSPSVSASNSGIWAEQPPLLDDLGAIPGAAEIAPASPVAPLVQADRPRSNPPVNGPVMGAPRLDGALPSQPPPSTPPSRAPDSGRLYGSGAIRTSDGGSGFEFSGADAGDLVNRVFAAVWLRVQNQVLRHGAGVTPIIEQSVRDALAAAQKVGTIAKPAELARQMVDEMVGVGRLGTVLEGNPDEVLVYGTASMRVNRGGHVTEGPSPFSCAQAVDCFVSRACGQLFDERRPAMRGHYGSYVVEAVHTADPRANPAVALRKMEARGEVRLEGLVAAGVLPDSIATMLAMGVVARQSILLCTGPGAQSLDLCAALTACAPAHERQIVIAHRGATVAGFRQGVVVVPRSVATVLDGALGLGPDRLIIEDLQWNEAAAVFGVVSRSMGLVLGVRGTSATNGLIQLEGMLSMAVPRSSIAQLLGGAFDLVVTLQLFADGVSRVTELAEPILNPDATLSVQNLFVLNPGTRTWQFSGVRPHCYDDLARRGFAIDPSIFA